MKYRKSIAAAALLSQAYCPLSSVSGDCFLLEKAQNVQQQDIFSFFQKARKNLFVILTVFSILAAAGIYCLKQFGSFKRFDYTGKESLDKIKDKLKSGDKLVVDFKKEEGFLEPGDLNVLIGRMVENLGQFFVLFEKKDEINNIAECCSRGDKKITVSFVCYDLQNFSKKLLKKYESISELEDLYNYSYLLNNKVSLRFPKYTKASQDDRLFFVSQVFGSAMIDQSYTRNGIAQTDILCQNMQTNKEGFTDDKLKEKSSKILDSIAFYKKVIRTTLEQTVNKKYVMNDDGKFNVKSDPDSSDLIKYILTARKIKKKGEEKSYNEFLEKIVLYIFVSANKINSRGECSEEDPSLRVRRKWKAKFEKKLFGYFLNLREGKNVFEVEKELISFLKEFLSEEELKDIKDNFLKDTDYFNDVFSENIQS